MKKSSAVSVTQNGPMTKEFIFRKREEQAAQQWTEIVETDKKKVFPAIFVSHLELEMKRPKMECFWDLAKACVTTDSD